MESNALIVDAVSADLDLASITRYDTRPVVQNEALINFFGPNATKDELTDNYQTNPLGIDALVYGIGFDTTVAMIRETADVVPHKVLNAIKNGIVTFKSAGGSKTVFQTPLSRFMSVSGTPTGYGTTAAAGLVVTLASNGIVRLPQQFRLRPQQNFDLTIRWKTPADFPTLAQWATAGISDGLRIRATLQMLDVEEYKKLKAAAGQAR